MEELSGNIAKQTKLFDAETNNTKGHTRLP